MSKRVTVCVAIGALLIAWMAPDAVAQHAVRIISADAWFESGAVVDMLEVPLNYGTELCVWVEPDSLSPVYASAFNFLVGFDDEGVFIDRVTAGGDLSPGWEYFTYRFESALGPCTDCPPALLRIRGVADLNDGTTPNESDLLLSGCIAQIHLRSSLSAAYLGQCVEFAFCSLECDDNTITSPGGDTSYAAASGVTLGDTFDPMACATGGITRTPTLDFSSGSLCMRQIPEAPGDLNLDGIYLSIGDAHWLARYFIYGSAVFCPYPGCIEYQSQESDINGDGILLTVSDYIALLYILTWGLGSPATVVPDVLDNPEIATHLTTSMDADSDLRLNVETSQHLGGLHLIFDLNGATIGTPTLSRSLPGISIRSNQVGDQLRVLIAPPPDGAPVAMETGSYELLNIPTSNPSALKLASADASDVVGRRVETVLQSGAVPVSFAVGQNVPNPFNAGTVIPFTLDQPDHVRIEIFDVLGRRVATAADGDFAAGAHEVSWDGTDASGKSVATGIYFYRFATAARHDVRKMLLLK